MLVFPPLCHGCGCCTPICSERAIREVPDVMGVLERSPGEAGISFARGVLYFGEPMAVPIIRQLKRWLKPQTGQVEIVDAPPGTSARLWNPARHRFRPAGHRADALWAVRGLNVPTGLVINRDGSDSTQVDEFCQAGGIPVLMRVPFERNIAEGVARGRSLIQILPEYADRFRQLMNEIAALLAGTEKTESVL